VVVSVLRSVARKRLVMLKNPNACATVCCKLRKSATALYLSVIKSERLTQLLINPIIPTSTRLISDVYQQHVTIRLINLLIMTTAILYPCKRGVHKL
jgi:hypothetical protein